LKYRTLSLKVRISRTITKLHHVLAEVIKRVTFKGAFGEVRKCQHKNTKALRAVKIINKKLLEKEEMEKMLNEIDILKRMVSLVYLQDHPNILKLYEFFQDEKRYFLVTE